MASQPACPDDLDVMWIEFYRIEWDAVMALPVLRSSAAALKAIGQGWVKQITHEQAQSINGRFPSPEFVTKKIAASWDQIRNAAICNEAPNNG